MADEILNPGDHESFRRLLAGLEQLDANLTKQIREQGSQTRQQVVRERRSAGREARARPTARPGETPEPLPRQQEEPARRVEAEEGVQRARRESSRLLSEESHATQTRLTNAERVAEAERDIARARAARVQVAVRQRVAPIGSPEFEQSLRQALPEPVPQARQPLGPDADRFRREQRDLLRARATAAKDEASQAGAAQNRLEGQAKAAQTRLRNLREAFLPSNPDDAAARVRQIEKAEAAVARAQERANAGRGVLEGKRRAAQEAVDREAEHRRRFQTPIERPVAQPTPPAVPPAPRPTPPPPTPAARQPPITPPTPRQQAPAPLTQHAAAEERIQRARLESSRLLVVESRASRDRLSAAERVAEAERDIARARAVRVQAAVRERIAPLGSPEFRGSLTQAVRQTGLFQPVVPPRRSTIDESELRRRRELAAPPPPPPPRQPPTPVAGYPEEPEPRRRGISLSDIIGGTRRPPVTEETLSDRELELYDRATRRASGSSAELSRELQFLTRNAALSGDQMHRHGLLTTEFLAAAAQGRTTIGELGVQIGGTIAKFGGWTLAAALTYGALNAVQQLGSGAVESLNGVTSLQRVVNGLDTEKAQEQFRSLAHEFNLPISQVTAASFEAAKAFRSQADIAQATRAALVGVKVGEIEAGEAARFVTAIYRGFHLEVSQLNDVMDVANQLQNRFGADFRGTAEGVAKSAGAFGAAGGNFRELAALVATGQLVTGRTGAEIGTALRRTSEIVRRPERRQTIIDVLGIDPRDHSITEVIERAQAAVARGADVGTVARAITTPELASGRIIPILQAQQQYQAALNETTRAGGSAQRELNTVLGSVGEKAKQVGVNLGNIGSSLAQSGALDSAVLFLDTLNLTLRTTQGLIDLFNEIPRPLRQGLVLAGQFAGTMALLRRFDTGRSFAEGGLLNRTLSRDPARLRRAEITQGLKDELAFVNVERERTAQTAGRLSFQHARAQSGVDDLLAANIDTDEHKREIARAQQRVEDIERRKLDAVADEADLADRQRRLVVAQNNFRRDTTRRAGIQGGVSGRERVDEIARREGILAASDVGPRPSGAPVIPLIAGQEADADARLREQVRQRQQARTAFAEAQASARAAGRSTAYATGAASLAAASAAGRSAATGARGLAAAIGASLGPLEIAVLGIIGVFESVHLVEDAIRQHRARLAQIERAPRIEDLGEARRAVDQATHRGGLRAAVDFVTFDAPFGRRHAENEAAERARQQIADIQERQRRGEGFTRAQIEKRFRDRLQAGADPDQALRDAEQEAHYARGVITSKPGSDARRVAEEDVRVFKERLRNYRKTIQDVDHAYGAGLSLEQLTTANQVAIFQRGPRRNIIGATGRAIAQARRELATSNDPDQQLDLIGKIQQAQASVEQELQTRFQRSVAVSTGPADSGRLRRQFIDRLRRLRVEPLRRATLQAEADAEATRRELGATLTDAYTLRRGAPTDTGAVQRQRARVEALRERIRATGQRAGRLRDQLGREEQDLALLERELGRAQFGERQQLFQARTSRLQSETSDPVAQARIARERAEANVGRVRRALRRGDASQTDLENAIADANRATAGVVEQELSAFDAHTSRLQSETADPVAQASIAASRGRERIARIRAAVQRGDRAVADLENAIAQQNRDIQQLAQSRLARFQAEQGLATAQFNLAHVGDESARMRRAITDAQTYANRVASEGSNVSPEDLINARRAVVDARVSFAEFLLNQARDLVSARAELAVAQAAGNPIREATIRLREAEQLSRFARTPAERLRAQAQIISRRRERQTTIYREQLSTIEFDADIGRIDHDVQLRRLEELLRIIHGNRDLRREIRRRIYQLRHDADSANAIDLDVGSIRLPTIYDVRRLAQRGTQGPVVVQQQNSYSFTVADSADAETVGAHLERIHGGNIMAGLRSAGLS